MLETMFNTMRVLVEGASNDDDVKLIPTNIFKGREDFNEAVVELLEKADTVNIFDFIKYAICIDVQIRHRLSDDTPTDFIDGALIQPSDFVDALNRIDAAFGVTEETFGLNVMSGSQHPNPQYAGLCGAFLQIVQDTLLDDQFSLFKGFINHNMAACVHNPSTTSVWWLETLNDVYNYESTIEGEEEQWFDPEMDEDSQRILMQQWYLHLVNEMGAFWEIYEEGQQTLPENALANKLIDYFNELKVNFVEAHEDKLDEGLVCKPSSFLKRDGAVYNIEQCLMVVMLGGM